MSLQDAIATTAGFLPAPPPSPSRSASVLERQRALGLDRIVPDQSHWTAGLLEPLHRIGTPVDADRYTVSTPLEAAGVYASDGDLSPMYTQLVLPEPYTLSRHLTGIEPGEALSQMTDLLCNELVQAPPARTLVLLAPSFVSSPPPEALEAAVAGAIDEVASAGPPETLLLPTGGAIGERLHAHLLDADVTAMGYDITTDRDRHAYTIQEYGTTDALALGLLDCRGAVGTRGSVVADRVRSFLDRFPVQDIERIYLLPNGPLTSIPWATLPPFLEPLSDAAATLRPDDDH